MKRVRFTEKYCADLNNRMSYELVSDEPLYTLHKGCWCYNLKLLGLVPEYKLEEADGTEIEAIDVWIELGKQ